MDTVNERDFLQSILRAAGEARLYRTAGSRRRNRRDGSLHCRIMKLKYYLTYSRVGGICALLKAMFIIHSNVLMNQYDAQIAIVFFYNTVHWCSECGGK